MADKLICLDKRGQIINGGKALTSDSVTVFVGAIGAAPAAVYAESSGTAAGKTGLTATVVIILFIDPLYHHYLLFVPHDSARINVCGFIDVSNATKILVILSMRCQVWCARYLSY